PTRLHHLRAQRRSRIVRLADFNAEGPDVPRRPPHAQVRFDVVKATQRRRRHRASLARHFKVSQKRKRSSIDAVASAIHARRTGTAETAGTIDRTRYAAGSRSAERRSSIVAKRSAGRGWTARITQATRSGSTADRSPLGGGLPAASLPRSVASGCRASTGS